MELRKFNAPKCCGSLVELKSTSFMGAAEYYIFQCKKCKKILVIEK